MSICSVLVHQHFPNISSVFPPPGGLFGENQVDIKFLMSHKHHIHQLARPPFSRNNCWSFLTAVTSILV